MKLLAVNFHYFREEKYSGGIFPVSKSSLKSQVEELRKYYEIISQNKLLEILSGTEDRDENYCIITFDDGLKEQINAYHFLNSLGVPAIFFACAKPLKEKKVLDVHKLHNVKTKYSSEELTDYLLSNFDITFDVSQERLNNQYRYDDAYTQKLKFIYNFLLSDRQKEEFINHFFVKLHNSEEDFIKSFYMDENDLRLLSDNDSLGSHGYSHSPLLKMPLKDAHAEITGSIKFLEDITNKEINSFAYPYGSKEAVNESIPPLFSDTRVRFALTMFDGINNWDDLSENRFMLKRIDTNDAPGGKLKLNTYAS